MLSQPSAQTLRLVVQVWISAAQRSPSFLGALQFARRDAVRLVQKQKHRSSDAESAAFGRFSRSCRRVAFSTCPSILRLRLAQLSRFFRATGAELSTYLPSSLVNGWTCETAHTQNQNLPFSAGSGSEPRARYCSKKCSLQWLFWVVLEGGAAKPMQSCLSYPFE